MAVPADRGHSARRALVEIAADFDGLEAARDNKDDAASHAAAGYRGHQDFHASFDTAAECQGLRAARWMGNLANCEVLKAVRASRSLQVAVEFQALKAVRSGRGAYALTQAAVGCLKLPAVWALEVPHA